MVRKHKTNAWVTAGLMLLASVPALAAGLGRLTVTSSLGQPFRGEIELLAVDKKDLGAFRATLASQEAFREARIERSPVLSAMRFSVEQKKSGEPYLKITSTKSVEEPFLDMLIELDWPSGRLVREYTVLLDPPGYSEPQEAVAPVELPVAAAVPAARPEMAAQPDVAKPLELPAAVKPEAKAIIPPARKPPVKAAGKEEIAAAKPAAETYGPVKKGENLSGIAVALKSEGISLEQMLVALFKSNKQAFDGDNMNRLKAGQILRVPEAGQIEAVEKSAAVTEVKAHSVDWHAYRQKLAAAVADAKPATEEAARQVVSGKITAAVEDKAALAKEPAKDVLKLSRSEGLGGAKPAAAGAGGGKELQTMKEQIQAMQEESTAKEKAIKEANQRIADLEKNIKEMQKLLELRNQNLADLQKQAAADKAAPAAAAPTPAAQAPASAEDATAKAEMPKPVPSAPVQPEISLLDELTANPLYLGGGAAAALLLALLGVRVAAARRRKAAGLAGSLKASGELQESAFLGGAGGARIDTSDTSFLTDFSQSGLGAIGTNEVDPIAEADVYMAYGRDAQAEEILKEALTKDPYRHEIRLKLLEIHAGRKNANAFGFVAEELHAALAGQASPIWDKAAAMGRSLDPDNPLYVEQPSAAAEPSFDEAMVAVAVTAGLAAAAEGAGAAEPVSPEMPEEAAAEAEQVQAEAEVEPAATDLGFEFDLGAPAEAAPETAEAQPEVVEEAVEQQEVLMEFDLGALTEAAPEVAEVAPEPEETVEPQEAAMEPGLGELAEAEPVAEETPEPAEAQEVLMEFDLGALPEAAPETAEAMPAPEEKVEPQEAEIEPDLGELGEPEPVAEETPEPAIEMAEPRETETEFDLGALAEAAETMPESEEMAEPQAEAEPVAAETQEQVEETAEPEAETEFELGALPEAAPEEAGGVVEEASAAEPAPVEVSISADAWKDEVMSMEFGSGVSAAPTEAPAPEDEMAEIGGEEETTVLDLPEFAASAETPFAAGEAEAIELAASPVEESPLDFDFSLGAEEEAEEAQAPSKAKGAPAPTLDLSGISLEMDELPSPKAATPEQPAADFGSQEVATKLDLAKAYMDMGDKEGAREILQEVIAEGSAEQQEEGRKLLAELA